MVHAARDATAAAAAAAGAMSKRTLLLTPWMAPHKIISWERAVILWFLDKVEVLEEYEDVVRSPSISLRTPAVVRLKKAIRSAKQVVRFSRMNVFARDDFRCQYCGVKKTARELNYDHVVPRKHGGKTVWENIVSSCYACNDRKGSRTPEQAGVVLKKQPIRPRSLPIAVTFRFRDDEMCELWEPYVPPS